MGGGFCPFLPDMRDGICSSKPWMKSHFQKSVCELSLYLPISLRDCGQHLNIFVTMATHDFQAEGLPLSMQGKHSKNEHWLLEREIGRLGGKEMYCSLYILLYFLNFEPRHMLIHHQELNDKKLQREAMIQASRRVGNVLWIRAAWQSWYLASREWFWFMSCSNHALCGAYIEGTSQQ